MMVFDREDIVFNVVINHEEQYSIWPEYKEVPKGWKLAGKTGSKKDCLDFIDQVWTDMRPLSLRKFMDQKRVRRLRRKPALSRATVLPALLRRERHRLCAVASAVFRRGSMFNPWNGLAVACAWTNR